MALMSHLESVRNRLSLLWSFLSVKSLLVLFTSCSPSMATMSPKAVLQKFSYCGLAKNGLNFDKRCLTRRGSSYEPEHAITYGSFKKISLDTER